MNEDLQPLLAVDIGNSTIGLGLFPDRREPAPVFTRKVRLSGSVTAKGLRGELDRLLEEAIVKAGGGLRGVIISSVVPELNPLLADAVKAYCDRPLFADHQASGLLFAIPHPEKAGMDRIAAALAGLSLTGRPTAVMDFGTATTISVVDMEKTFLGGAIMPGLDLMAAALGSGTSELPGIEISIPLHALGADTVSAMISGIVIGTAGAALKIISSIEEETGLELRLVATGGWADTVSPFIGRPHTVARGLIFEGLRLIYNALQDM
jgi:type III pantothenate kinase